MKRSWMIVAVWALVLALGLALWGCSNSSQSPSTSNPGASSSSTDDSNQAGGGAGPGSSEAGTSSTQVPAPKKTVNVDVVVYGTQTSGIAAVHEITQAAPDLRVALISPGNYLESPLAQGLCVEDSRNIGKVAGGMYAQWRNSVIGYYEKRGQTPYTSSGRLVYQPQIASGFLWSYVKGPAAGKVEFFSGNLLGASDAGSDRWAEVDVTGVGPVRLNTTYFIDASVEADLARLLGADYRVGRSEDIYNDRSGPTPTFPGPANSFVTAPQWPSALLTLKIYPNGDAPLIAKLTNPNYDSSSYGSMPPLSQKNVAAFRTEWSLNIAKLPGGERELNQTWTDYSDAGVAFQWIFDPAARTTIFRNVLSYTINKARYLQEHGYPDVGIAKLPQTLYIREGPRIQGLVTYTENDILNQALSHPVAIGCYAQYDRHDAFWPTQINTTRFVYVPMEALMVKGHPWLLVSTAVSTDFRSYSSAVRMEPTRANLGGAAGAIIAVAHQSDVSPAGVAYSQVRAQLLAQGYKLPQTASAK